MSMKSLHSTSRPVAESLLPRIWSKIVKMAVEEIGRRRALLVQLQSDVPTLTLSTLLQQDEISQPQALAEVAAATAKF